MKRRVIELRIAFGVVAVVAGLYWAQSSPPAVCSSVLADQAACHALTVRHNLALVMALVTAALFLVSFARGDD